MKKYLLTVAISILSQAAFASDLYCGANVEEIAGSQVYNKLVFWEKTETTKSTVRFLLADGTFVKAEELTPVSLEKIVDGTTAMSISFTENRPQLFLGKVKRNENNEIRFTDLAMASSFNGNSPMLIANGVSLLCNAL